MKWLKQSAKSVLLLALSLPFAKAENSPTLAEMLGYKSTDKLLIINSEVL